MADETYTADTNTSPPSGTTFVDILCRGGAGQAGTASGGQSNTGASGGNGGEIQTRVPVSPEQTLYIRFSAGGAGGDVTNGSDEEAHGGDGGDGSDVRLDGTALSDRLVGAGGGGGGGAQASNDDGAAGVGGDDEQDGETVGNSLASGGTAGSQSGAAGGGGGTASTNSEAAAGGGGGGGFNGGGGGGAAIGPTIEFAEGAGGGGGDTQHDPTQSLELVSESHGGQTSAEVQLTWGESPVSNFSAVADSGDQITLSWTNDATSASQYDIYRDTSPDVSTNQSPIATISASETSYTDTGLLDGERYDYVMVAVDSNGTALSITSEVDATTTLPAPTNLTADGVRASEVDISWTNNHDNGTVTVQQKPADTSTWQDATTGLSRTTTSDTLTGLRHGEEYDIRVLAVTEHITAEDV